MEVKPERSFPRDNFKTQLVNQTDLQNIRKSTLNISKNKTSPHVGPYVSDIPTVSKTTDDLLLRTRDRSQLDRHRVRVPAAGSVTRLRHQTNASTSSFTTKKPVTLPQVLNDYNSVQQLPLPSIQSASSIEKNLGVRQFSKVELSRKDMQSFLVTGNITKEFIKQNKKELEKFIKGHSSREEGSRTDFFKGYHEVANMSQAQKISNSPERSAAAIMNSGDYDYSKINGSEEDDLNLQNLVFPEDQKPEKSFKGETTSGVGNRVIETWINETLKDAEHLDIPGVILKPKRKDPINRYGIDKISLNQAGLSFEDIDRIYRSLFVHSVGYFELLKKVLRGTLNNYQIITSLWKVFNVLLEYCCKTDYKLLVAEIVNKHTEEKRRLEIKYKDKMTQYIENEKTMKNNMDTLNAYAEKLEKDKTNERDLRLKLEEEYMQNSKNHEEEVKLRLKFENKFNQMHQKQRELDIKHERTLAELGRCHQQLKKQEAVDTQQRIELVSLRAKCSTNETVIGKLEEWKKAAETDIKRKNHLIQQIEAQSQKTKDESDMVKYSVVDTTKMMQDLQLQNNALESKISNLAHVNEALKTQVSDAYKLRDDYEEQYNDQKGKYNGLVGDFASANEALKRQEVILEENNKEIKLLTKEKNDFESKYEEQLEISQAVKIERDKMGNFYEKAFSDLKVTGESLHLMNLTRHDLEKKYNNATQQIGALETQLEQSGLKIENLESAIINQTATVRQLRNNINDLEESLSTSKRETIDVNKRLTKKIGDVTKMFEKEENKASEWTRKFHEMKDEKEIVNRELAKTEENKKVVEKEREELKKEIEVAVQEKVEAYELRESAFEKARIAVQDTLSSIRELTQFEHTIKHLQKQMAQETAKYEKNMQAMADKIITQQARDKMALEEQITLNCNMSFKIAALYNIQDVADEYKKEKETLEKANKELTERIVEVEKLNEARGAALNSVAENAYERERTHRSQDQETTEQNKALKKQIEEHNKVMKENRIKHNNETKELRKEITEFKYMLKTGKTLKGASVKNIDFFVNKEVQTAEQGYSNVRRSQPVGGRMNTEASDMPKISYMLSNSRSSGMNSRNDLSSQGSALNLHGRGRARGGRGMRGSQGSGPGQRGGRGGRGARGRMSNISQGRGGLDNSHESLQRIPAGNRRGSNDSRRGGGRGSEGRGRGSNDSRSRGRGARGGARGSQERSQPRDDYSDELNIVNQNNSRPRLGLNIEDQRASAGDVPHGHHTQQISISGNQEHNVYRSDNNPQVRSNRITGQPSNRTRYREQADSSQRQSDPISEARKHYIADAVEESITNAANTFDQEHNIAPGTFAEDDERTLVNLRSSSQLPSQTRLREQIHQDQEEYYDENKPYQEYGQEYDDEDYGEEEPVEEVVQEKATEEEVSAFRDWFCQKEKILMKKIHKKMQEGVQVSEEMVEQMRAAFMVPKKLKDIKMSTEQTQQVIKAQQDQAQEFQKEHAEELQELQQKYNDTHPSEQEDETENKNPDGVTKPKAKFNNIFVSFAMNAIDKIENMVQKQTRDKSLDLKKAQERVKIAAVDDKVENQVKGKREGIYLIRQQVSPGFKERHQKALLQALKTAEVDKAEKPVKEQQKKEVEQKILQDAESKELERRKAKLAKIEVVREDLQPKLPVPVIPQKKIRVRKGKHLKTNPSKIISAQSKEEFKTYEEDDFDMQTPEKWQSNRGTDEASAMRELETVLQDTEELMMEGQQQSPPDAGTLKINIDSTEQNERTSSAVNNKSPTQESASKLNSEAKNQISSVELTQEEIAEQELRKGGIAALNHQYKLEQERAEQERKEKEIVEQIRIQEKERIINKKLGPPTMKSGLRAVLSRAD